jgi:hypothetical protein
MRGELQNKCKYNKNLLQIFSSVMVILMHLMSSVAKI